MFDDYTTITYNNWSTLQAQQGFCQAAASVAAATIESSPPETSTTALRVESEIMARRLVPLARPRKRHKETGRPVKGGPVEAVKAC